MSFANSLHQEVQEPDHRLSCRLPREGLIAGIRAGRVIVAPTGISEDIEKFIAPARRSPGIAEHLHPFVKSDTDRVVSADIVGEAKARRIRVIFRLKAAEELVHDNEG